MLRSLLAGVVIASPQAFAQEVSATTPVDGERLNDWLLRRPAFAAADLIGTSWRAAAEVPAQRHRKETLLRSLGQQAPALLPLVERLPVTGRVPLHRVDVRWLQANPSFDPVLTGTDSVIIPSRSTSVAVLHGSGRVCLVPYEPAISLQSYLQACGHTTAETAWLIQPDGHVSRYGLRPWNQDRHDPPAPGAWIWAPAPDSGMPPSTSQALAEFIATQGPALDDGSLPVLERRAPVRPQPVDAVRGPALTYNDWGVIGLWQMPTARQAPTGSAAATVSTAHPYTHLSANLQPFEWLSGGFRYTNISGVPYGPANWRNDQSYKDKSVDLKLTLLREDQWLPEVAVGWRDIGGTGVFSGEYIVGSKRFDRWDATLGLGFGYMGRRGNVRNPFGLLSSGFDTRTTSAKTGEFTPKSYFHGPAALFGGIQYQTPWDRLILKLEYDGNDYRSEYGLGRIKARTPFNAGFVWRYGPSVDLAMAVERGNAVLFSLTAHTQLDGLSTVKTLDAPAVPVAAQRPPAGRPAAQTAQAIESQTSLQVDRIARYGDRWTVIARDPLLGYVPPQLERTFAIVHRDAPPDVDQMAVRFEQRGTRLAEFQVHRDAWARSHTQLLAPSQRPPALVAQPAHGAEGEQVVYRADSKAFTYGFGISYRQNLGGPDAFLMYQFAADAQADWRLRDDTWLSGTFRLGLIDNYDKFSYTAPSGLPRVRTYLREYFVTSRETIPAMQLTHVGQLGANHFYMAYGGMLEMMYAGVGAEYLYRPVGSRLALGVDANRVQQREFNQRLGLRNYKADTGHATVYWDTGFSDMIVKASVGQYLAKDRGATIDISRTFSNGVAVGAYATKTNVSSQQFGEGSFDKGIYVRIPFDAMLPKSGPSNAWLVYNPLIRDGGARLWRRYELYDLTYLRDPRTAVTSAPAKVY